MGKFCYIFHIFGTVFNLREGECSSFGMRFGYYAVLQLIIDVVIICGTDVCLFPGSHSLETRTCIICELKVYF